MAQFDHTNASYVTPSMAIYSKKGRHEGRMVLILELSPYALQALMAQFDHPNVLGLIGVCTKGIRFILF